MNAGAAAFTARAATRGRPPGAGSGPGRPPIHPRTGRVQAGELQVCIRPAGSRWIEDSQLALPPPGTHSVWNPRGGPEARENPGAAQWGGGGGRGQVCAAGGELAARRRAAGPGRGRWRTRLLSVFSNPCTQRLLLRRHWCPRFPPSPAGTLRRHTVLNQSINWEFK